jgi:hypothetical protein
LNDRKDKIYQNNPIWNYDVMVQIVWGDFIYCV